MNITDYIAANAQQRIDFDTRVSALETSVAQNTQDISDNTDAIAELGELIGGEVNG